MKRWLSTMTAFAVAVAMGSAATALAQTPKHGGVPHHSLYSYGRMQEVWLDR